MNIEKISSKFKQQIQKKNLNSALRLLADNGILPLSDGTLKFSQTKHPKLKLLKEKLYCRAQRKQFTV